MTKAQQKALAFTVGAFLLAGMLVVFLFGPDKKSFTAYLVVRTVLGLAAAAFVVIVPGTLQVNVSPTIRATGAIGIFVFIFLVNPASPPPPSPPSPTDKIDAFGYLGDLHDELQEKVPDAEFVLILGDEHKEQLRLFWVERRITAGSYPELMRKICRKYSDCLRCEPDVEKLSKSVTISWLTKPTTLSGTSPHYSCNATIPTSEPPVTKSPAPTTTVAETSPPVASPQEPMIGQSVVELAQDDPLRTAAPTVGQIIRTKDRPCTAFLISRDKALTTDVCAVNQLNMTMRLGYHKADDQATEYPVVRVEEIDPHPDLGYAVLQLSGAPGDSFGFLAAKQISIDVGTPIAVIHHSKQHPLAISTGKILEIRGSKVYYQAATAMGAAGSPVVNEKGELVALHQGNKEADGSVKEGLLINAILAKSTLFGQDAAAETTTAAKH